jgi:translation initiation factor IF-2
VKGATVRILRGSEILFEGPLKTLRNVKTDVNEMEMGQECGMSFRGYEDYEEGDVVECYM